MRVPIQFVQRPGSEPGDTSPVVPFSVGWLPKFFRGFALVDTGADSLIVDQQVLVTTGCPTLPQTSLIKTLHATIEYPHYQAELRFDDAKVSSVVDVVGMDLSGRAYNAIFGIRLLELGKLVLDKQGDSYFEFHSDSLAPPE